MQMMEKLVHQKLVFDGHCTLSARLIGNKNKLTQFYAIIRLPRLGMSLRQSSRGTAARRSNFTGTELD